MKSSTLASLWPSPSNIINFFVGRRLRCKFDILNLEGKWKDSENLNLENLGLKCKFFIWCILHRALNTQEKLQRRAPNL